MSVYFTLWKRKNNSLSYSQCCGSEMFIQDPGSDFFPSRIPDPNCLHPGSRICIKELSILTPKKTKKMVSKLQKIWFGLFIPDPGSGCWLSTHPKSRIQGSKRHRIPDPDPQHCLQCNICQRSRSNNSNPCTRISPQHVHCTLLMTSRSGDGESKITRNKWRGERWVSPGYNVPGSST
jgi:hypothetical protein